jgi:hypothetical protein
VAVVSKTSAHGKVVNGKTSKHPSIIDSIFNATCLNPAGTSVETRRA